MLRIRKYAGVHGAGVRPPCLRKFCIWRSSKFKISSPFLRPNSALKTYLKPCNHKYRPPTQISKAGMMGEGGVGRIIYSATPFEILGALLPFLSLSYGKIIFVSFVCLVFSCSYNVCFPCPGLPFIILF